jgi:hypothetical protein
MQTINQMAKKIVFFIATPFFCGFWKFVMVNDLIKCIQWTLQNINEIIFYNGTRRNQSYPYIYIDSL